MITHSTSLAHPASPSIFISSTIIDLRDLRSALAYVLKSQGVRVYTSEAADFLLHGDRTTIGECFDRIPSSDYYILVINGRKGATLEDGLSVTRHE